MIHILLLILKIIGIILLVILCLALLILFFPITYIGNVNVENKSIYGRIKAGWLFYAVFFGMKFEQADVSYTLRIFGIPVLSSKKKHKKDIPKEESAEEGIINDSKGKKKSETLEKEAQEDIKREHIHQQRKGSGLEEEQTSEGREDAEKEKTEKKSFIETILEKIQTLLKEIKAKVFDIQKNIKEYYAKVKEIKNFITANTTKEAYRYGKQIIKKLAKHILPRKIRGNVRLGFEEPHLTGQTLGYVAMGFSLFHINPRHIVIEPDFENSVLDGNIRFRGRIVLGVAAFYVLKLYFKREIKEMIKKFQ